MVEFNGVEKRVNFLESFMSLMVVLISMMPPVMYGIAFGLTILYEDMVWKYNFKVFHLALPEAMAQFASTSIPATHLGRRRQPQDEFTDLTPHLSNSSLDWWTTAVFWFRGIDVSSEPVSNIC